MHRWKLPDTSAAMKFRFPSLALFLIATIGICPPATAVEKGDAWLPVPAKWLLSRFVRPSTATAKTYRVAIAVPPASNFKSANAKVVKSSGFDAVDAVASDYARETIRNTGALRELSKSKELYFQLTLTPPGLDINMRSEAARRPIPAGRELDAPTAPSFFVGPNQNQKTSSDGKMVVVFPAEGGFASEVLVTSSTANSAVDRYYLHTAALNWRTTRKSAQEQVYSDTFGASHPPRWQSIYDY